MNHKTNKKEDGVLELYFYDEENNPCEEERAHIVAISKYDKDGKLVKSVIGTVDKSKN